MWKQWLKQQWFNSQCHFLVLLTAFGVSVDRSKAGDPVLPFPTYPRSGVLCSQEWPGLGLVAGRPEVERTGTLLTERPLSTVKQAQLDTLYGLENVSQYIQNTGQVKTKHRLQHTEPTTCCEADQAPQINADTYIETTDALVLQFVDITVCEWHDSDTGNAFHFLL